MLYYLLTPWCRVLQKPTGLQLVKKFPHFTEPEGSLPYSQASANCLYTGPVQSSPHTHTSHLLEIHPNIHPSIRRSPHWSLSLRFPHQDPIHPVSSPTRATCPTHLILLDFITPTILGEEYESISSSTMKVINASN